MDRHQIARFWIAALAASLLTAPAAADGVRHETRLVALSNTAMSITGNVRLREDAGGNVSVIVFQNGSSLKLTPGPDFGGVYRVTPPANPLLLHGNRLCGGSSATWVALAFGIHGAVSMLVYNGKVMSEKTLCGQFNYTSPS